MYYDDHSPPHFHAYYGSSSAQVAIDSLEVLSGVLPKRVLALVIEWAISHRQELRDDWQLACDHQPLAAIDPLE